MKEVPNRIKCAYCIRHYSHGGECNGQQSTSDEKGCLIFRADEKGCIRNGDFKISVPMYYEFPPLNTWCKDWEINGIDTEIRIKTIQGLNWDKTKGYLIVHCNCDYYINEYHDEYVEAKQKPKFKIIK